MTAQAYPLTWPAGWPRARGRHNASFHERTAGNSQKPLTIATAFDRLEVELAKIGAAGVIVSTNRERRVSGLISAAGAEPSDPGVAVYFKRKGRDTALACDTWTRVADNINAIAKHVEAIRGMERWGVGSVDQVFTGYQALPAPDPWWIVLGLNPHASRADVDQAFRTKARNAHPDAGGDRAGWDRLQAAYEAREGGAGMMRGKRWTEDEIATVRTTYPASGVDGCATVLPDRGRGAIAQLAFRLGLRVKANLKVRWTEEERDILRRVFPTEGVDACAALLPRRGIEAIRQQALRLDLKDPTAVPAGRRSPLDGKDLERAMDLRRQGWSHARIGQEFGVAESTAANAIAYGECLAAGFQPVKRDAAGGLFARDVQRLRQMLMAGMTHAEVQRQLGISAGCVSHHRRRYEAELKTKRKGKTLPPPGGGKAYSGRKLATSAKRDAEQLYLAGHGTPLVAERTGISHSHCLRLRAKLIKRLARRGEVLPGCDAEGVRRVQKDSTRFIPEAAREELRRRILAREPVMRAAHALAIGTSSAYRVRDELAAELKARGEELLPPIRGGNAAADIKAARVADWLPRGSKNIFRFRQLCRMHPAEEAKAMLLRELAEERRAEAARPKSFEEQLARVRAGATISQRVKIRRPEPSMTLGGIATGAL